MPIQVLEETPSGLSNAHSLTKTESMLDNAKRDVKYRSLRYVSKDKIVKNLKVLWDRMSVRKLSQFAKSELIKELLERESTEWSLSAIPWRSVAKRIDKNY